jgi:hypothetical protein
MANEKKTPYRIYLPDEVIKALDDAAENNGLKSGNLVAAEVIIDCLPVWLAAYEATKDARADFLRRIVAETKRKN